MERLKFIKTLAHKEWGLSQTTLISIYKSLMRSLVEYSTTIFYLAPTSSTKRLQTLQNDALRSILKIKREYGNFKIHRLANIQNNQIQHKIQDLNYRYFSRAQNWENSLFETEATSKPSNLIFYVLLFAIRIRRITTRYDAIVAHLVADTKLNDSYINFFFHLIFNLLSFA